MTLELEPWRMAAVALCEYACGYEHGRDKGEPVYIEVTEHRDGPTGREREHYSSCGDLAWWLLFRLGLRLHWMNRAANGSYDIGMNVADLTGCPVAEHGPFGPDYSPQPGDILEIWSSPTTSDAHVCVVLAAAKDGILRTANYGAGGMNASLHPGANIANSPYERVGDHWVIGKARRRLQRVIPLASIVPLLTELPDLTGAKLTGEVIDAVHAAKWTDSQTETP